MTFEIRDATGILTLNRPDVHNVVDEAVMKRLEAHLARIEADSGLRVLILTGAGHKTFSAGGDLGYFESLETQADAVALSRRMQSILRRLAEGPRPVIAALNGSAWGGGCEILTAAHLRLAVSGARFAFRQAAMGVTTGWGGGGRLFRLVGRSSALRLLLTAEPIDAEEARRIGLVDRVIEPGRLMAEALALARQIAANSPRSIQAFLELARVVDRSAAQEIDEAETRLFSDCWTSGEFRRNVEAWNERRGAPKNPKNGSTTTQ